MKSKKYLIVLVGPTAIGKTAAAIKLAQHFRCEIVSCDSRQFFREMTIGTAVPTKSELAAAKHHFIHNKSILDEYTVGDFEKEAVAGLDRLFEANDFAILVGGSGLYVDAVLKGFDKFPEIDARIRENLAGMYRENGISFLQSELQRLDPEYYATVDRENPQRIMRALEVAIGSGKPYSSFLSGNENQRSFTPILIGIDAGREIIYDRINRRVDAMLSEGLVDEAKELYPHKHLNALQTVGYRELFDYFEQKITLETAVSEIKKNTRRFAKRQLTWFKRNDKIKWFDYLAPDSDLIAHIREAAGHTR